MEPVLRTLDITKPDYGLPDVCLDSEKYYSAFSNPKAFLRANNEPWMLWQPPESLVQLDKWAQQERKLSIRHDEILRTDNQCAEINCRLKHLPLMPQATLQQIFLRMAKIIDDIIAGTPEASEEFIHKSCLNYLKGWSQYLKEQGYTCIYRISGITEIEPGANRVLLAENAPPVSSISLSPLWDLFQYDLDCVATCSWNTFTTVEMCEIQDRNGVTVHSTSYGIRRHLWKFGWNSTTDSLQLYDIDNQVALRAYDILTKEKLFLDANARKDEVWTMTKSL